MQVMLAQHMAAQMTGLGDFFHVTPVLEYEDHNRAFDEKVLGRFWVEDANANHKNVEAHQLIAELAALLARADGADKEDCYSLYGVLLDESENIADYLSGMIGTGHLLGKY